MGSELDIPDSTLMALERAVQSKISRTPELHLLVLGASSNERIVGCYRDNVDVLEYGLAFGHG